MTSKPLKTVDEILCELVDWHYIEGGWDENDMPLGVSEAITQLNKHYKELFLSIIGEDEKPILDKNTMMYKNNPDTLPTRNNLRATLREKLAKELGDSDE